MVAAGLDWGEVRRPRSCFRGAGARSGGAAARAEIFAARSLAHPAVDAAGELRLARRVARADSRNCEWAECCGARAVSFPRRYQHCFTLEGPRGEFVQLTPAVARHIARAIETSRGIAPAKRRGSTRGALAARRARVRRVRGECFVREERFGKMTATGFSLWGLVARGSRLLA